jgi:histidinol-phosphate aminotransferase
LRPKSNIVHLPVYQPGKPMSEVKREFGLDEVIKLASNENPYGCSQQVKSAILAELENTSIYPDGASSELTAALAEFLGISQDQLIFGAGSDEVVLMLARAFLVPGDETIMATHTFPQYKHNAEIEGAVIVEVPLREGTHDLDAMFSKINDKTKIVWICNPNNPTGTMVTHEELKTFMDKVPAHVLVVLDEAYYEYNVAGEYPDSLAMLKEYDNIVILRTFSKIYGLASLRIGYGIGRPEIIHYINQVREPFNTTRYAQTAAVAALKDQEFIAYCREQNDKGIQYLTAEFKRLGLEYFPTSGNFIMVDVKQPAKDIFEKLLRKGIIVRGGHSLGFPTSLRVTVGSPEQNGKFIEVLTSIL